MNKNTIFTPALLMLGLLSLHADRVTRLRLSTSAAIHTPLLTDTIDVKGKKINIENLMLDTSISTSGAGTKSKTTELSADTAGCFSLGKKGTGYRLYVLNTSVRADRFTHATLKVTSPQRVQVYVDGVKKGDKYSAEDSLKNAGSASVSLRMEPEMLYRVAVKVLASPEDKEPPTLKMEIVPGKKSAATIACSPELKSRALVPTLSENNYVSNVLVSPDGKYLLTTIRETYSKDKSRRYTTLSDTRTRKVITTFTGRELGWMPRSSRLWYTANGPQGTNVFVVDPATLQETLWAENLPESNFRICPDERHLLTSQHEAIEGDKGPLHRVLSPRDRSGAERGRWFIGMVDVETGVYQRLTYGLRSSFLQDVSSDSRYLLFSQSESTPAEWPFGRSSFYRMNLETFAIDTLISGEPFADNAKFSPDGTKLVIMGGPEAFGGIGKNCGNHPIANDYDKQAYLFDVKTKQVEAISRTFNPSLDYLCWNTADGCIYFKTNDKDRQPVYRYSPARKAFERLPLEGDCIARFSLSNQSTVAAYTTLTTESPAIGYLYDTKSRRNTLLADPNASNREKMEFGEIKDWSFRTQDGTEITGYYCLPPQFDPTRKYPLIVYYYGGTTPSIRTMHSPYSPQILASRDYVVYILNPSGTIGFGQEFSARHVNAWGKYTADEIIEGTQKFCREHAFVDSARVGCMGASYGGFMTEYLQTKTKIFRAAVSHAGISNVTSYWGEGYWGVGYNAVAAAQSYPWQNPELFTKQGALFNADKITTPLLLLHGTVDTNVPIGESIQLYNALKILGRPVEFIQVDGENHIISDITKRQLWQNTIMAWFARWLQDAPQWWEDLYPEKNLQ